MRFQVVVVPALFCLFSCSKQERPKNAALAIPVVSVERATLQNLDQQQTLAAEFRPYQEVDVHAKVAGYVKKIYVDVGDRVKQGQTLAVLEIPEMVDELTRMRATKTRSASEVVRMQEELVRAQAAHTAAHVSYERLSGVAKSRPNLIAAQEIDDARARDQAGEAQVSAARAALASAQGQVDVGQADIARTQTMAAYGTITAPFAGVITHRYADNGAMVPAGTSNSAGTMPVVKLSQLSTLRLILPVPESLSARIHRGDMVTVRVPALSRQFTGHVIRTTGTVATNTRTMETEVDVENPTLQLIPGMYAEAVLVTERRQNVLAVPLAAIAGSVNVRTIYAVDRAGYVRVKAVKTGLETATRIEITSGLEPGALVITGPRSGIVSGEKVVAKLVDGGSR